MLKFLSLLGAFLLPLQSNEGPCRALAINLEPSGKLTLLSQLSVSTWGFDLGVGAAQKNRDACTGNNMRRRE